MPARNKKTKTTAECEPKLSRLQGEPKIGQELIYDDGRTRFGLIVTGIDRKVMVYRVPSRYLDEGGHEMRWENWDGTMRDTLWVPEAAR